MNNKLRRESTIRIAAVGLAADLETATREAAGAATEMVMNEHADEVARITREQALAIIRSPQFAAHVREHVRTAALECAREILAESLPDLEERVRSIVHEHWDKSVAAAAHTILDEKLADIRRKLT